MALTAFSQALEANQDNPTLYLYIAESLQSMGYASEALELLNSMIETCGDHDAYKEPKARAEKLRKKCEQIVQQANIK